MNGPNKSATEKDGGRFDGMECGMVFAGALVVIGLLMESWPEITLAISEHRFPNLTVTGGVIVTVGVLIEVVLGIFITQRANRAQSEANERVARAEQATSEANLARAKLEAKIIRVSVSRNLNDEEEKALVEALRTHSGQKFTIRAFRARLELNEATVAETDLEQSSFVVQLHGILSISGWIHENIINLPDFRVAKGLTIFWGGG